MTVSSTTQVRLHSLRAGRTYHNEMAYLVDTNVFLRLVAKRDPGRQTVLEAIQKLKTSQEDLCYTTQVLAEFWTVCTRPATARGGYGLSPQEVEKKSPSH